MSQPFVPVRTEDVLAQLESVLPPTYVDEPALSQTAYQLGYLASSVALAARTPKEWQKLRREVISWHKAAKAIEAAKQGGGQ